MANEIYSSSWWGVGPCNDVGWGIVYKQYANCGVVPGIIADFTARVIADGGTVESEACLDVPLTFLTDNPIPSAYDYLLDDYSGAAAAYSLRQLSSTYSGDAIRVRRLSDNTEQNIGFVSNELDTASLETFCSGTDGFVAIWYDQSGNANNVIQGTASKQPKIVASGSTILDNGKPIITPVDSSSRLQLSQAIFNQDVTSFLVAKNPTSSINTKGIVFTFNGNLYLYAADNGGTGNATNLGGTIDNRLNGSSFPLTTRDSLHDATINQSLLTAVIGANNNLSTLTYLGWSSSWCLWDSQEIILYNNDESANISGIETNINDHYSIY